MKVYHSLEEFKKLDNAIVTTGTFDGVHIGHQAILSRLVEFAKKEKGESVLITFFPHPRMVLQKDLSIKLLNTVSEKIALLNKTGIDHLLVFPFTKEFSRMSSMDFVRDILVNKIGTKKLVIGYDHQFGRNREGSFKHLQEFGPVYGFGVEEISALDIDDISVSSTKIRTALIDNGDVKTASKYLGSFYHLSGNVVSGKRLGSKIGFPTANIRIEEDYKLIPKDGVYVVSLEIDRKFYKGMLNIGKRPTIEGKDRTIEVNIFDFDKEIYNHEIKLCFIDRLRDEKKFESLDALKKQLSTDKINALKIINSSI
ncbi:MAG: bifunctional riboflavin kinase/FAD synthetase [Flavobacteriales bacterium]|nr:bifunctional riboflavin kinase/FAD synthetase [Flavobacteriales bacterium]